MKFCPGCGKPGGLCEDCRPASTILVKDMKIRFCASCRRYHYHNNWKIGSVSDAVARVVKDKVKGAQVLSSHDAEFKPGTRVEIIAEIARGDEAYRIPIITEFTYCDRCSKEQGEYFEGVLQLRNINDEIISFVKAYLKHNGIGVSKEYKIKDGVDLNIRDKKKLQNLGNELHRRFGGEVKASPRLFTQDRQTSKEVFRLNVFYKAPDFSKGDVLAVDGKLIKVTSISKEVKGRNLMTGSSTNINLKDKEYAVLKPQKTTVSKVSPNIEVLDPETYQSMPIQNRAEVVHGEKIEIVNHKGLYYIL